MLKPSPRRGRVVQVCILCTEADPWTSRDMVPDAVTLRHLQQTVTTDMGRPWWVQPGPARVAVLTVLTGPRRPGLAFYVQVQKKTAMTWKEFGEVVILLVVQHNS